MQTAPHRTAHHSWTLRGTGSTRIAMPSAVEGDAPVLQSNEVEYLSTRHDDGINYVEGARLPQTRFFFCIELPEFFLIETVEPLDLQGCPVIQHDVEYDVRKQVQGEQGGDKLLGPLLARDQLTEDGQYLLQIGRI